MDTETLGLSLAITKKVAAAQIVDAVEDWLDENITGGTGEIVVDSSLSVQGAAADAKKTGDEITNVLSAINYIGAELENRTLEKRGDLPSTHTWTGYIIKRNGGNEVKTGNTIEAFYIGDAEYVYVEAAPIEQGYPCGGFYTQGAASPSYLVQLIEYSGFYKVPTNATHVILSYEAVNGCEAKKATLITDDLETKYDLIPPLYNGYVCLDEGVEYLDENHNMLLSTNLLYTKTDLPVTIKNNIYAKFNYYDSTGTTALGSSGWKRTDFTIPAGKYFKIQYANSSVSEINDAAEIVYLRSCVVCRRDYLTDKLLIQNIQGDITEMQGDITEMQGVLLPCINLIPDADIGNYKRDTNTGELITPPSNYAIIMGYIPLVGLVGETLQIKINSGYQVALSYTDNNNRVTLYNATGWKTADFESAITHDCLFIQIARTPFATSQVVDPSEKNNVSVEKPNKSSLEYRVSEIEKVVLPYTGTIATVDSVSELLDEIENGDTDIILIENGTYNVSNIEVNRKCQIVGESRTGVILVDDGSQDQTHAITGRHGIRFNKGGVLRNLTFNVNDVKYVMHQDNINDPYDLIVDNCTFNRYDDSSNYYFFIGCGCHGKQNITVKNSTFIFSNNTHNRESYGVYWHNWNLARSPLNAFAANLTIENCGCVGCGIVITTDLTTKDVNDLVSVLNSYSTKSTGVCSGANGYYIDVSDDNVPYNILFILNCKIGDMELQHRTSAHYDYLGAFVTNFIQGN